MSITVLAASWLTETGTDELATCLVAAVGTPVASEPGIMTGDSCNFTVELFAVPAVRAAAVAVVDPVDDTVVFISKGVLLAVPAKSPAVSNTMVLPGVVAEAVDGAAPIVTVFAIRSDGDGDAIAVTAVALSVTFTMGVGGLFVVASVSIGATPTAAEGTEFSVVGFF